MSQPREITESFRLERVLKSSRSGIVLRAIDPATNAPVAIKLIPNGSPGSPEAARAGFTRMAETLAAIHSPAFPAVLDHGFTPDASAFLVMEFIEGTRLDAIGEVPVRRVLELMLQAIDGLEALAAAGVAHGNLAPDNLFAVADEGREQVKVHGLGTAAYGPRGDTATGPTAKDGTAHFAAPERCEGDAPPDWRGDIYSLGLIAAALLHGETTLLDGAAPAVTLPASAIADLPDPEPLRSALERSLSRDPHERPASWDEVRHAFRTALTEKAAPPVPAAAGTAVATAEAAALIEPDELELEDAPAWLAGGGAAAAPREAAPTPARLASAAPGIDDTNPVLIPPPAAASVAPPAWLDDGSTQRINLAERLRMKDAEAPAPSAPPAATASHSTAEVTPPAPPAPPAPEAPEAPIETTASAPEAAEAHGEPGTPGPVETPPPLPAEPVAVPDLEAEAGAPALPAEDAAAASEGAPGADATPVPVPEPQPASAREAVMTTAIARPKKAPAGRRLGRWAAAIVAVVLVGAGAAFLWIQQTQDRTAPRAASLPTRAPARPTPVPPAVPPVRAVLQMQSAEHSLSVGDWAAASDALDAISSVDQAQLAPRDLERLRSLRESIDNLRRSSLARDLRDAVLGSNIRRVRDSLRGLTREDEQAFARDPDLAATLEEAKRAVNLQAGMLKAQHDGSWSEMLASATSLLTILPRDPQAAELRERAAKGIEQEADALALKGRYEQALARLDAVAQQWPDRPGLAQRGERIRADQAVDGKLGSLFATAEKSEADKVPEKGIELLQGATPNPRWEPRFRQLRDRLEKQLAELDAAPPVVELVTKDTKLEYQKGKSAELTFRITDDHAVKSARLFARPEGTDRWVELPLRHASGVDYVAEITSTFHQNGTVEFYVGAADYSNHVGQFGTAQAPMKLKRKKNWLGL